MLYRPYGRSGFSLSAVSLRLDETYATLSARDQRDLVFCALEHGINGFHLENLDTDALSRFGAALNSLERPIFFISLGLRPSPHGFHPEDIRQPLELYLQHSGLRWADVVMLEAGQETPMPDSVTLQWLRSLKSGGHLRALGFCASGDARDEWLNSGRFDVACLPYNLDSGWDDRNRIARATGSDMTILAFNHLPEAYRDRKNVVPPEARRGLFRKPPASRPLAGAGTYAFLHDTPGWNADQLCLAISLNEPRVASVLVTTCDRKRLASLAAVPDRQVPSGLAAQLEMARFSGIKTGS